MPHIIDDDDRQVTAMSLHDVVRHLAPTFGPEGLATRRSVDAREVGDAFRAIETRKARNSVRVYSAAGFVPASYRYPCRIQYVEAVRTGEDTWQWRTDWDQAQRPDCRVTRVVIR